jgi:hypothetical protein
VHTDEEEGNESGTEEYADAENWDSEPTTALENA